MSLIRKRDFLKKRAIDTKEADDWNKFKRALNTVNNEIKIRKSNYYKEACFTHKKDPSKLWSAINEVCSRKPKSTNVKNLEIDNQKLTNSTAMAEAFNEYFSTIGCKLTDAIGSANSAESFLEYLPIANSVFSIEPTSSAKVLELMLKLSKKKAIGLDGISSQLIKISAPVIVASITEIFNCSIVTRIFPDEWKAARVTPVFKGGSPSDVNNYRPISIIPMVAKTFEKFICDQFYEYLSVNNLLSNCQPGFRALHSTVTSLLNSTDKWHFNIDKVQINGVVFVDLEKAFDTVDHAILITKLRRYGLNDLAIRFLGHILRTEVKAVLLTVTSLMNSR